MGIKSKISNRLRTFTLDRHPNIFRPASSPFLSGDSIRSFSDYIFDEGKSLNPKNIKENDIIFLNTSLKEIFFNFYHPLIEKRYILITHNSDDSVNSSDFHYIDDKIIHWFAAKLNAEPNKKISPMAYGLENRRYLKNGVKKNYTKILNSKSYLNKIDKVFCSFNTYSNPKVRFPVLQIAEEKEDLIDIRNYKFSKEYLDSLSKYKFNLCPEGNDFESHRIWESLIFRCTPILISNQVNKNYYNIGIPLILLDDWEDLRSMTINDLNKLNAVNEGKEFEKFSSLEFWQQRIKRYQ